MRNCPMCVGVAGPLFKARDENRSVSKDQFYYAQCMACQTIFLEEIPKDLYRYYEQEYYEIPNLDRLNRIASKDKCKIETVTRFVPKGRLLEIGPAFGIFAMQAKMAGFVVDVVEMDARCCAYLADQVGVNVVQSSSPHLEIDALPKHNVIAIWHVLEHLPEPAEFMKSAAANLLPGGILVIAMPNPGALQFRLMRHHWPHLDAPRHLELIPIAPLRDMAVALGLKEIFLTSDDAEAKSWNQFGWQRLLMNRFESKLMQRAMQVAGFVVGLIMAPFESRGFNGSAYTIVFQKT